MKYLLALPLVVAGIAANLAVYAAESTTAQVHVTQHDASVTSFTPFTSSSGSIGSVAVGDLGTDGVEEIIVGAGQGMPPLVGVFRQDGSKIGEFLAYNEDFRRGVTVAVCDVDGDGDNDIVTGAQLGGGPHIRIFDSMGSVPAPGFFAYSESFLGGVNVACGDVNNDGTDDIVTGAGPGGGPHIRIFTYKGKLMSEIFNGSASENVGVHVQVQSGVILAADIAGEDESVTAFVMYNDSLLSVVADQTGTRSDLIATASLNDGRSVTADVASQLFTDTSPQYILVDVGEQILVAYEYGVEVNRFLISSGTYSYPTPLGKTSVTAKLPVHDYGGPGYYLPNVLWNMRFRTHYYIHSAYWHNNFGHRMSHGCINMSIPDAAWMYAWTNVGTAVEIIP